MNERSPGGGYSRPETPNRTGRPFRSQWEESEKVTKPLTVNIRATTDTKNVSFQQHSMEDVSKSSYSTGSKKKRVGGGVSDPRFKRVISSGTQNDACVGTEKKSSKPPTITPEKEGLKSKSTSRNDVHIKSPQVWGEAVENLGKTKSNFAIRNEELQECENLTTLEHCNPNQLHDNLKEVDKLSFSHILVKSFSRESLSDCTVNTRNTSLASEEQVDDFSNDLSIFPSATRVKKVQNWIEDCDVKPDKKQSVITVIGQTQGQDSLSSALWEMNKRRKSMKELDKYAICKKILETEKEKEISDLLEKINFITNSGKGISSKGLEDISNDLNLFCKKEKEGKIHKHSKLDDFSQNGNDIDLITDFFGATSCQKHLKSSNKKLKKWQVASECSFEVIKNSTRKVGELFVRAHCQWIFCIMIVLSVVLFWFTISSADNFNNYVSFDLFTPKPKPMTWYEKICMWIWEIFRPSANYRRTVPWQTY